MILVRYGELALKGKNRYVFENKLARNIKTCLKQNNIEFKSVKRLWGRIQVDTDADANEIKNVFGIANYSHVKACTTLDELKSGLDLSGYDENTTFRVSVRRQLKKYPKTSREVECEIGDYVVENTNAKVKLKGFEKEIGIEIHKNIIYYFTDRIQGLGGLPIGSSSTVQCYLEEDKDAYAVYLMMKRGCNVLLQGNKINYKWLKKYAYGSNLEFIDKITEGPVILGQTLEKVEKKFDFVELRPLVAFTKKEVLDKIGELS